MESMKKVIAELESCGAAIYHIDIMERDGEHFGERVLATAPDGATLGLVGEDEPTFDATTSAELADILGAAGIVELLTKYSRELSDHEQDIIADAIASGAAWSVGE